MEEIIYLEPDEEITSVIDKMNQAKSNRLALVVPREATILQSVVNLKLLAREAANSGKEIALVTGDKIGRNLASQIGLNVYDSIKDRRPVFQPAAPTPEAQEVIEIDMSKKPEEKPAPNGVQVHHFQKEASVTQKESIPLAKSWQQAKKPVKINWSKVGKIILPITGLIILLVLVAAYFTLPKVLVKIRVKAESFQKNQDVQLSSSKPTSQEEGIFSGNLIEFSGQKEEKFVATGKKNLGGKATGTLTLYNYWDSSVQSLGKGTKFSSSSKTFLSKAAVNVPGTSIRGGNIVPGTATVEIEAENPGEDYNVKAGRFTIIGLTASQQEKIYGQASKDLTGGFTKDVTVISQEDYDRGKAKLTQELNDDLKQQLVAKSQGMEVLDKAIVNDNLEFNSSAKVDSEANDFILKITQRSRVIVFNRDSFDSFVINILEKQISEDQMITLGPEDMISIEQVQPQYDKGILNMKLNVTAKVSSRVDTEKISHDLLGKNRRAAEDYLNSLPGIDGYDLKFTPSFWLKRIPTYSRALKLELEYISVTPQELTSPSPTLPAEVTQ